MDGNTSQVNMSLTIEDGAPPATAAEVTTSTASIFGETKPAPDLSTQVAPSPAPMFHPDSLVTLLIGPEEEKMAIHTTYLSLDSAFFKAALKKQWTEGQTRVVKLPEESPETMQLYIEHLYGSKMLMHDLTSVPLCDFNTNHYEMLAKLYVLGERTMNAKYQNVIIHEFFRFAGLTCGLSKCRHFPGTKAIVVIYNGTTSNSPARRMMADFAVFHGDAAWFYSGDDSRYLLDVTKALFQRMMDQTSVRDFRLVPMNVEYYLVSEEA
jgi:hypothetical protein